LKKKETSKQISEKADGQYRIQSAKDSSVILKKRIKYFHDKFISLKGEPKTIAMGIAIGVFVGVTPTIPFHTALLVIIAILFKQNVTAAYLGSWIISNPITIPFFYLSQYELGLFLLGITPCKFDASIMSIQCIINLGWQIAIPLLVGGVIMAPIFALPAYFIAYRAVLTVRKKINSEYSKNNYKK